MTHAAAAEPSATQRGATLVAIARTAICRALDIAGPAWPDAPWLHAGGATFVTLTKDGDLRGCIGTIVAHRALREDVEANALAAAFRDPRFAPVGAEEMPDIRVEVSELSELETLSASDRDGILARLQPGYGYVLECGRRRATFLPQVWEQLPDPAHFLRALERKAELHADDWRQSVRLERYSVRKWEET